MTNRKSFLILPVLMLAGACANTGANYQPVIDGPVGPNYSNDLAQCQQLAASQAAVDGSTAGNAAIGAAGAAATTAIIQDSSDNLGRAAAAGALLGAGADVYAKNQNREVIVRNCMRGRGYNVVG
ncbi:MULTISPECIES: glycine zipper family protein [Alphaproteobacteria]|uniref:glycine zipper family protein n=1 Tax=Alphaproteobacteria TaxID=28211 RepID=UPI0012BC63B4|nr:MULTISPECIES: glycine zipper family protein [Alphaproteobacteria]